MLHEKTELRKNNKSRLNRTKRRSRGTAAILARAAILTVPATASLLAARKSLAANATTTWVSGSSFQSNSNWNPASAPGGNSNSSKADVAVIPSGPSTTIDLFNTSNTVSASGGYYLGELSFTDNSAGPGSDKPLSFTQDSSTNGSLYLNGSYTTTNLIISDTAAGNTGPVTIQSTATFGTLSLQLQNSTNIVQLGGNSVLANVPLLTISSSIGQASGTTAALTVNANTTSSAYGGMLVLSGANTFSGGLTISGGTLVAAYTGGASTAHSSTGTSASGVTLNNATLSSQSATTSYIAGAVTATSGTNVFTPGGAGAIGTLAIGGTLSLASNDTIDIDLSGATSDEITTNSVSATGTTTISFASSGLTAHTTYTVLTDPNSTLSSSNFTFTGVPSGWSYAVNAHDIELDATSSTDTWTVSGTGSGTWNTTSTNWTIPGEGAGQKYASGDAVIFGDTGTTPNSPTVTIQTGGVTPATVTISNTNSTYDFVNTAGDGNGISGSASVVMAGPGTATFSSSNTYTGGTTLSGGTLIIDGGDTRLGGSSGSIVFAGGTLQTNTTGITSARNITVNSSTTGIFNTNGHASSTSGTTALNGTLHVETGGTTGGSLALNGAVTFGASSALNIDSGTTLTLGQTGGATLAQLNGGTYNGTLAVTNAQTLNFEGTFSGSGQLNVVTTGTLITNPSSQTASISPAISLNPGGTYSQGTFITTIGGTPPLYGLTISGNISGPADLNVANATAGGGSGYINLNGSNSYAGQTIINLNNGSVVLGQSAALPSTTDVIFGTAASGNIGNPTLNLNGTSPTINSLSDGATASSSKYLTVTNTGGGTSTLTLSDTTTPPGTIFSGILTDGTGGTGALALQKNGSSSLQLSGSNTYSGGTTVGGGTLVVKGGSNSTFSPTGSGGVTLSGATLSSKGSSSYITGAVTATTGTNTFTPGGVGSVGTLAIGGQLSLASNDTIDIDLSGATTDLITANSVSASGVTNISFTSSNLTTNTTFTVLSDSGGTALSNSNFTFTNVPSAWLPQVNANDIELDPRTVSTDYWSVSGTGSGTWDIGTSPNWKINNNSGQTYAEGDAVIFGDTGTTPNSATVTIASGGVNPSSVTISNTNTTYDFVNTAGDGHGISGSTGVTMAGPGTATFSSSNTYTGGTTLSGGTLIVDGGDSRLGGSSGSITFAGGTLQTNTTGITSARNITVNSSTTGIFNTNGLASSTSGTTGINGTLHVETGGTSGGSLALNSAVTFGTSGALNIDSGTTLTLGQTGGGTLSQVNGGTYTGTLAVTNAQTLNFEGTFNGSGQINVGKTGTLITNPSTTLASGNVINPSISLNPGGTYSQGAFVTTIGGSTAAASGDIYGLTIAGNITGPSDVNIANATAGGGSGYLYLNGSNSYAGQTVINLNNGSVVLGQSAALPSTTDLIFGTAASGNIGKPTLDLNGTSPTINSLSDGANASATKYLTVANNGSGTSTLAIAGSTAPPGTTFSGVLADNTNSGSGKLALTMSGSNTLVLTGSNTYSGGTQVQGGTLRVNGTNSGTGAVTVSGGTLSGSGTIAGAIQVETGATISPGGSATGTGSLTTTGGEIWDSGGFFTPNLTSTTGTNPHAASLAITGGLNVSDLSSGSPFTVEPNSNATAMTVSLGEQWVLATIDSTTGYTGPDADPAQFVLNTNEITTPSNGSDSGFGLEMVAQGGGAYDLDLVYNGTPEPGSALLVLSGVAPMLMRRRRRKAPTAQS